MMANGKSYRLSTDGGKTWQLLRGLYTTPQNPNGNNLGWGYTGISGKPELLQKDRAKWVREIVNLSPYAGQEVLLRFEYITDDAVSHPGLFIDDISIPEIGYYEDFESGYGGWEPHGEHGDHRQEENSSRCAPFMFHRRFFPGRCPTRARRNSPARDGSGR